MIEKEYNRKRNDNEVKKDKKEGMKTTERKLITYEERV